MENDLFIFNKGEPIYLSDDKSNYKQTSWQGTPGKIF